MKLALCLEYPIDQFGGTEVLVRELVLGLSARHRILLVSPDDAAALGRSSVAGLVAEHIHWTPRPYSSSRARELADTVARAKPDLAHFHFGGNYAWGNRLPFRCPVWHLSRRGIPCISTVHLVVDIFHGVCDPRRPLWVKLCLLPLVWCGKIHQLWNVRREIAASQHDFQKLRRWYRPLRSRFAQIYHSRLRDAPPILPAKERQPVILNVGHIAMRKGQTVLAEAFARIANRHPQWKLQLAGYDSGDGAAAIIRQIIETQRLDARIQLLGQRDDAPDLMQRASVFVQPSFQEGLPLSLQEALYHGCACAATRISGNTELIEDGANGLLVPPGDRERMAVALDHLLTEETLRARFTTNGRASILAKGMTSAHMIRQHERLYESVLQQR